MSRASSRTDALLRRARRARGLHGVPAAEVKDDLAHITAQREELEALLPGTNPELGLVHPGMEAGYCAA